MKTAETKQVKIKICGLTRVCDIDYINEAAPDYIGFVFAESRRRIKPEDAEKLRRRTAEGIRAVGVFVDEAPERILALLKEGIIDAVQLHGKETPHYVNQLKEQSGCAVIKALHPGGESGKTAVCAEYAAAGTDYFLFDSGSSAQAGGTGERFDWSRIPNIAYPYFLAGGLNTGNIEEALRTVAPYGVDISSGVETNGVKDQDKILDMIRRIRNV